MIAVNRCGQIEFSQNVRAAEIHLEPMAISCDRPERSVSENILTFLRFPESASTFISVHRVLVYVAP